MARKSLILAILLAGTASAGLALAVLLSIGPPPVSPVAEGGGGDVGRGKIVFTAGGCLNCHAPAPESGIDMALPAGGQALKTPLGSFYPPNLTPDPQTGLGRWRFTDFSAAMKDGRRPDGAPYYPAFPYTSYRHISDQDLADLWAYLKALPAVENAVPAHTVPLAEMIRPLIGPWQRLALGPRPMPPDPARSEAWNRGAYLVQGLGHCGECHTPRNLLMVMEGDAFLAGARHPEGGGRVPGLGRLIARERFKDAEDLGLALRFGETLGYEDMSSGGMGKVQENLGKLPEEDTAAIAEFLLSLD
jgi:mono/diheme cytochrome c family protein